MSPWILGQLNQNPSQGFYLFFTVDIEFGSTRRVRNFLFLELNYPQSYLTGGSRDGTRHG